ncbi:tryptophan synthase subunit beta [bacterium DOLZORAL124_64_63]|nr:MAG: tryptophan synthase subunit beta [bacterium DOLZORAL124_64_63]
MTEPNSNSLPPNPPQGRFGPYGGQYVPDNLIPALQELERLWLSARRDPAFTAELTELLADYAGRPTSIYRARRLETQLGGRARIYLKREDLNHTGAHKINNCLGQVLLAKRMGKKRIVAETGAGQHGVATATVCALMGLDCTIYMGEVDMARQAPNVRRMKLLGARVQPVTSGTRTLQDASSQALEDWVTNVETTHFLVGSVVGPHPYPAMVKDFQKVIGQEARKQILARENRLPDAVVACVGGGSNASGIFAGFMDDADVALFGVEAGGTPSAGHSAALGLGQPGVLHGSYSYLLRDADGNVSSSHSVAAGLNYPGVGPEHSHLKDTGRVRYGRVTDEQALAAFDQLSRLEGIIPALESSHAVAYLPTLLEQLQGDDPLILVNLSGRGDKDMPSAPEGSR